MRTAFFLFFILHIIQGSRVTTMYNAGSYMCVVFPPKKLFFRVKRETEKVVYSNQEKYVGYIIDYLRVILHLLVRY